MKFRDYFSLKQILFALLLFALLIPIAMWDSETQIKVSFDETSVYVNSDRLGMTIGYDLIQSAELAPMGDPGEKAEADAFDNGIIRTGLWTNDAWGEYNICADLDTGVCVVAHLHDGRIFVFSQKDDATTEEVFNTLLSHLAK